LILEFLERGYIMPHYQRPFHFARDARDRRGIDQITALSAVIGPKESTAAYDPG
jgi:hypothetical protein